MTDKHRAVFHRALPCLLSRQEIQTEQVQSRAYLASGTVSETAQELIVPEVRTMWDTHDPSFLIRSSGESPLNRSVFALGPPISSFGPPTFWPVQSLRHDLVDQLALVMIRKQPMAGQAQKSGSLCRTSNLHHLFSDVLERNGVVEAKRAPNLATMCLVQNVSTATTIHLAFLLGVDRLFTSRSALLAACLHHKIGVIHV